MIYIINKIASYILFVKLQRSFECNEWFLTILYLTFIEFLILCPFIFFLAMYISQFASIAVLPIMIFGDLAILYLLNKKVYGKYHKTNVYELAFTYDVNDLNKIKLAVFGIFLAACSIFIGGMHLVSRL